MEVGIGELGLLGGRGGRKSKRRTDWESFERRGARSSGQSATGRPVVVPGLRREELRRTRMQFGRDCGAPTTVGAVVLGAAVEREHEAFGRGRVGGGARQVIAPARDASTDLSAPASRETAPARGDAPSVRAVGALARRWPASPGADSHAANSCGARARHLGPASRLGSFSALGRSSSCGGGRRSAAAPMAEAGESAVGTAPAATTAATWCGPAAPAVRRALSRRVRLPMPDPHSSLAVVSTASGRRAGEGCP